MLIFFGVSILLSFTMNISIYGDAVAIGRLDILIHFKKFYYL